MYILILYSYLLLNYESGPFSRSFSKKSYVYIPCLEHPATRPAHLSLLDFSIVTV